MSDFKRRIYQAYRTTTSRNPYSPRTNALRGNTKAMFESRWGRFLPTDKEVPILDVACGSGEFLLFLRQKGYRQLAGIDLSHEQVQAAKDMGLDSVLQTDALSYLTDHAAYYAMISAFSFLEHLTRDELFAHLDAVVAALQPDGVFLGVVPNAKGPFGSYVHYADITHELSFTPESIVQIAAVVGLEPIYIGECGPVLHSPVSFLRWLAWQSIRGLYLLARVTQAADYHYPVYTQDLRFVLRK
jgi:2-polyprenyl-3-methyl-5-hydroxy-6-metoxy-1,4-benzoquinol methylase